MSIRSMKAWADRHHPKWLDALRVLLGFVLLIKGISFIIDKETVAQVFLANELRLIPFLLVHYVIVFQITHGALLIVGLLTRVVSLLQIPIVLGALYVVWIRPEFSVYSSDVLLALIVLFLLLLFFFYGAGPYSVDAWLKRMRGALKEADVPEVENI